MTRLCMRCRRRYVPELLLQAVGAPVCILCLEPKDEALAAIRESEAIVREGGRERWKGAERG